MVQKTTEKAARSNCKKLDYQQMAAKRYREVITREQLLYKIPMLERFLKIKIKNRPIKSQLNKI